MFIPVLIKVRADCIERTKPISLLLQVCASNCSQESCIENVRSDDRSGNLSQLIRLSLVTYPCDNYNDEVFENVVDSNDYVFNTVACCGGDQP